MTKTEKEYFFRAVKKKVVELAIPDSIDWHSDSWRIDSAISPSPAMGRFSNIGVFGLERLSMALFRWGKFYLF